MKKTFLSRRNALLSPPGLGAGSLVLLLAVLALLLRGLFPDTFLLIMRPVFSVGNFISFETRSVSTALSGAATLTNERDRLSEQNLALAAENQVLAQKVAALSALLGDTHVAAPGNALVLDVVARPPESPYDSLVVSGGSADGVVVGMEAFGNGMVPIGSVESVTAHFARITLFSAPGVSLSAWVGASHTPLTLSGRGAGAFAAAAPRSSPIMKGDVVFAPGAGALPLGVVRTIGGDAASPTETVFITPSANPFTLSSVVVRASAPDFAAALSCATSSP